MMRYTGVESECLSVCLPACLSRLRIVWKWLNMSSNFLPAGSPSTLSHSRFPHEILCRNSDGMAYEKIAASP